MNALAVLIVAAILTAAAAAWMLRAYRRADSAASPKLILGVCAGAALVALGLYLVIGQPGLPGAAHAARIEALKQRDPTTYSVEEALAILGEAARARPADAAPHLHTGVLLLSSGQPEEAARAFDAALRRDPTLRPAQVGLARALVQRDGGRVSPDALRLFEAAAASDPDDPAPWLYQAMAAMQESRDADARRLWGEALRRMAPDDPRRAMAAQMSAGPGR